jgi:hypothetical protein
MEYPHPQYCGVKPNRENLTIRIHPALTSTFPWSKER